MLTLPMSPIATGQVCRSHQPDRLEENRRHATLPREENDDRKEAGKWYSNDSCGGVTEKGEVDDDKTEEKGEDKAEE